MTWYKLANFTLYKIKLTIRRRYVIVEKILLRFKFGKSVFEKSYLFIIGFNLIGSIAVAISIAHSLQQVQFTDSVSYCFWRFFYFALLSWGCFSGLQVTGRTLFPEDMEILSRLPFNRRYLSIFAFAEHLSSIIITLLLLLIIPIFYPLMLTTSRHISLGLSLLITILLGLWSLLIGLLIALAIRTLRFFVLLRSSFSNILFFQAILAVGVAIISYKATVYFFGDVRHYLSVLSIGTTSEHDYANIIAQCINVATAHLAHVWHVLTSYFQCYYCPYNLATNIIHKFKLYDFKILIFEFLFTLILTTLFMNRFQAHSLISIFKTPNPNVVDKFTFDILSNFKLRYTGFNCIFKKNLLMVFRNLEIIQSNITSLFGSLIFVWIILGLFGGISKIFCGDYQKWNIMLTTYLPIAGLTILQANVFFNIRFLVSIDGEGRNIALLRLAKVSLKDLFVCQVNLFRVITLPACVLFMLTLGVFAGLSFDDWILLFFSMLFIILNVPKVLLLGSVTSPHFEVVHFEESGQCCEQKISDNSFFTFFLFMSSLLLVPIFLFISGAISKTVFWTVTVIYWTGITTLVHYLSSQILHKFSSNIGQAQEIL